MWYRVGDVQNGALISSHSLQAIRNSSTQCDTQNSTALHCGFGFWIAYKLWEELSAPICTSPNSDLVFDCATKIEVRWWNRYWIWYWRKILVLNSVLKKNITIKNIRQKFSPALAVRCNICCLPADRPCGVFQSQVPQKASESNIRSRIEKSRIGGAQ